LAENEFTQKELKFGPPHSRHKFTEIQILLLDRRAIEPKD